MARKITPLKYVGPKNGKGSPLKAGWFGEDNWIENRIEAREGEFRDLKKDLMDTDVTQNFYKDIVNPYAGLDDPFASLENTAEDLTVDQKRFQQQERTLQRGLSQTLQASKQTGTSNVQNIANQLAQSSGDIAADIGAQESANQRMAAQAAGELQLQKAGSKRQTDLMIRKGRHETEMQKIKGAEDALSRDLNKQQALLGLVSGELARSDAQKEAEKGFLGVNWSF